MIHKLEITASVKNGRTILKDCFFTQPFRVANISEDKKDPRLYLMAMSSSPGLLNEDEYAININVTPGADLMLQSQAYQRIFKMNGSARIHQQIDIGNNATLYYVPHPLVPHNGSTLVSETDITSTKDSRFMVADILTCGRKHSGEIFQYCSFRNRLTLKHDHKVIYKDNIVLVPAAGNSAAVGQFEDYTHQAGFVMADMKCKIDEQLLDNVHNILKTDESLFFGITRVSESVIAGRILAKGAEQLFAMLKRVEKFASIYWNGTGDQKQIVVTKQTAIV
jgi:urease accessory protein